MNTIHIAAADQKTAEEVFNYLDNLMTFESVNIDTEANVYAATNLTARAAISVLNTRFGRTTETIII